MKWNDLLAALAPLNIRYDGGKLLITPAASVTPQMAAGIKAHRAALVDLIETEQRGLAAIANGWNPFPLVAAMRSWRFKDDDVE